MKLSYRGVSYQSHPSMLEATEFEIGGKYRGINSSSRYVRHIPAPPPAPNPMYRGVAAGTAQPAAAQPVAKVTDKALPTCNFSEKVLDEMAVTHQENIRRSLEHRLKVAKANGDRYLLRLLLAESEQIAFQA